jgi:phosphoribosylaminoimidazole-succinocarboxamide synthase
MILSQCGIQTHLIKRLNMREQLIKEAKIIPVELKSKFVKKFSEKLRDLTITENEINKCYTNEDFT